MANKPKQSVVITTSGKRPVQEVAAALRAAGVKVDEVLEAIGVITGSAEPAAFPRLRTIDGVADVSAGHDVDIGPPGSPIL